MSLPIDRGWAWVIVTGELLFLMLHSSYKLHTIIFEVLEKMEKACIIDEKYSQRSCVPARFLTASLNPKFIEVEKNLGYSNCCI